MKPPVEPFKIKVVESPHSSRPRRRTFNV